MLKLSNCTIRCKGLLDHPSRPSRLRYRNFKMSSSDDDSLPLAQLSKKRKRIVIDEDEDADNDDNGGDSSSAEVSAHLEEEDNNDDNDHNGASEGESSAGYDEKDSEGDEDFVADNSDSEDGIDATAAAGGTNDDDSDSDDSIPLSALRTSPKKKVLTKKKKKSSTVSSSKTKKKTPAKRTTPKKKSSASNKKNTSSSSTLTSNGVNAGSGGWSGPMSAASELYAKCEKGKLIQNLLCRWWYALTWPEPSTIPQSVPDHTDALEGFPGVYIHTSGDSVGKIEDVRDQSLCPCFANFANKPSHELRDMLLVALEKQKDTLVAHEGSGTQLEKELGKLTKWATKFNPSRADKEVGKVLKAAKLNLPAPFSAEPKPEPILS